MKIVIDIPDEDYKFIKDLQFYISGRRSGRTIERNVINGIRNGTPLPNGHGRLIDADAYIDKQESCGWLDDIPVSEFNRITPTIIEADKETKNEKAN